MKSQNSNIICGKLRTRWMFSRAVTVSVSIWKLGLWDLIFVHPGVKINGMLIPSYHHQSSGPLFGTQCSFVDEIKLNYSLANTTLQYVRVAISGCVHCTVSVKCLLVNYSDTTSSSVFSQHIPGSDWRGFVRTQNVKNCHFKQRVRPIIEWHI